MTSIPARRGPASRCVSHQLSNPWVFPRPARIGFPELEFVDVNDIVTKRNRTTTDRGSVGFQAHEGVPFPSICRKMCRWDIQSIG